VVHFKPARVEEDDSNHGKNIRDAAGADHRRLRRCGGIWLHYWGCSLPDRLSNERVAEDSAGRSCRKPNHRRNMDLGWDPLCSIHERARSVGVQRPPPFQGKARPSAQ